MKSRSFSSRGQVLVIFVLAVVGIIGMTGLAIDGGNILSDRRHAQNAADTAAMAAALTRNSWGEQYKTACLDTIDTSVPTLPTCSPQTVQNAWKVARDNGYDGLTIHQNKVDVYSPPIDGPYHDCSQPDKFNCNEYIQVVIQDDVNTWFARVLGVGQLHNRVSAVAYAHYAPSMEYYGGMTLVQLRTGNGSCPSDFNVSGNGSVTLDGGGIWVNSTNEHCAYKETSCTAQVIGLNGAEIQVVGGAATTDSTHCTSYADPAPIVEGAGPHYPYTPSHIFPAPPAKPKYCTEHTGTWAVSGGAATYQPGDYQGQGAFPMYNGPATLQPGVYCVDRIATTKDITGNGVFVYVYPTVNHSQVDMSGGVINMSAITDPNSPYAGFLIYADWDENSHSTNPPICTIAGGTNSIYKGMIWVPLCALSIEGNTASSGESAQIIAAEITLGGTMDMTFKYDSSVYPKIPEESKTGLSR